jgi:hypothetical protein
MESISGILSYLIIPTNSEIQKEGNWKHDIIYLEAVMENYEVISRYKQKQYEIINVIK